MPPIDRVLIHASESCRVPIEPAKVFYLEADGDETILHVRTKRKLRDVRSLGEVLVAYLPHGFVRQL